MQPEFDLEIDMLTAIYLILLSLVFGKVGHSIDDGSGSTRILVFGLFGVSGFFLVASIIAAFII